MNLNGVPLQLNGSRAPVNGVAHSLHAEQHTPLLTMEITRPTQAAPNLVKLVAVARRRLSLLSYSIEGATAVGQKMSDSAEVREAALGEVASLRSAVRALIRAIDALETGKNPSDDLRGDLRHIREDADHCLELLDTIADELDARSFRPKLRRMRCCEAMVGLLWHLDSARCGARAAMAAAQEASAS